MKVNRKKLLNEIEEIIAYGCAYGEEVDVTTAKINAAIEPLVLAVETLQSYQQTAQLRASMQKCINMMDGDNVDFSIKPTRMLDMVISELRNGLK